MPRKMVPIKKLFILCITFTCVPTFIIIIFHSMLMSDIDNSGRLYATSTFKDYHDAPYLSHSSYGTHPSPTNNLTLVTLKNGSRVRLKVYNQPDDYPQYFRPNLTHEVSPLNHKTLIHIDKFCSGRPPFLIVLILTMHANVKLRNAVRETWGSAARDNMWAGSLMNHSVKYIFLMGKHKTITENINVENEAKKHKDILMFDFQEGYYNLTLKVLLALQWLTKNCKEVEYVMKIDEDTFIHLPRLLHKLEQPAWNKNICGFYAKNEQVMTTKKNANNFLVYPFKHFPPHVKGNLYFMPFSIAAQLVNVSKHFQFNVIEDVYITGILAKVIALGDRYKGFTDEEYDRGKPANICDIVLGPHVASTHSSVQLYEQIWLSINNPSECLANPQIVPPVLFL